LLSLPHDRYPQMAISNDRGLTGWVVPGGNPGARPASQTGRQGRHTVGRKDDAIAYEKASQNERELQRAGRNTPADAQAVKDARERLERHDRKN
jgi:hypothetical protein